MNPRMCVVVILIVLHYGTWNRHGSLVGYGQLTLWPCFRKCSSGQVVFDFFLGLYSVAKCIKKRALERFLAAWWLVVPKGLKKKVERKIMCLLSGKKCVSLLFTGTLLSTLNLHSDPSVQMEAMVPGAESLVPVDRWHWEVRQRCLSNLAPYHLGRFQKVAMTRTILKIWSTGPQGLLSMIPGRC